MTDEQDNRELDPVEMKREIQERLLEEGVAEMSAQERLERLEARLRDNPRLHALYQDLRRMREAS